MALLKFASGDSPHDIQRKILLNQIAIAASSGASTVDSITSGPDLVVATAGTPVPGASIPTVCGVILVAKSTNKGSVYVGGATVTNGSGSARGMELIQGGMTPLIPVSNLDEIFLNADNNNDVAGVIIL